MIFYLHVEGKKWGFLGSHYSLFSCSVLFWTCSLCPHRVRRRIMPFVCLRSELVDKLNASISCWRRSWRGMCSQFAWMWEHYYCKFVETEAQCGRGEAGKWCAEYRPEAGAQKKRPEGQAVATQNDFGPWYEMDSLLSKRWGPHPLSLSAAWPRPCLRRSCSQNGIKWKHAAGHQGRCQQPEDCPRLLRTAPAFQAWQGPPAPSPLKWWHLLFLPLKRETFCNFFSRRLRKTPLILRRVMRNGKPRLQGWWPPGPRTREPSRKG